MGSLLRIRGFQLLLLGQFLSLLAPWTQRTLVLIWVYALTQSGTGVSFVGLAEALPVVLLATIAGVFVDRWSRSRTMAFVALCQAVIIWPLVFVTTAQQWWIILVVTFFLSVAGQFFNPAAAAALPQIVRPEAVVQANGMLQITNSVVPILAPGVAALLYASIGPHKTVFLLAIVYLLAVPVLLRVPAGKATIASVQSSSLGKEMVDGLAYVVRSRLLLSLTAFAFVALLGVGGLSVLDVVFVTRALHGRSEDVGALLTATGIGQLVGGMFASAIASKWRNHYHRWLAAGGIVAGLATVLYALSPSLLFAAVALFLCGLALPSVLVPFFSMVQLTVENSYMGRVMSLISTGITLATIISLTVAGTLTDHFNVRFVIAGGGLLFFIAGIVALLIIRPPSLSQPAAGEYPSAAPDPVATPVAR
ncbi:MAG: MFS transporter [Chloroflexi bacterium]|nr:MFS transporter [Chloroflexota bacterium]